MTNAGRFSFAPPSSATMNAIKGQFFARVYDLVETIPPGRVMTYGQIAALLDHQCSARVVGYAMSAAPEERNLPCHRVVNRFGEMAPGAIFGGAERQRELLEREGTVFTPQGRVDLALCLFTKADEGPVP